LANSFDGLSMLAAQSGLGSFDANVIKMDRRSGQRRERYRLAHDGAASRVPRAIDFKHKEPNATDLVSALLPIPRQEE
jgi:hypothetical protein